MFHFLLLYILTLSLCVSKNDKPLQGGKKQEDTGVEIEESENPTFKGLLSEEDSLISSMSVEYEPLGINRRANPNVSSEILGGFETGRSIFKHYDTKVGLGAGAGSLIKFFGEN